MFFDGRILDLTVWRHDRETVLSTRIKHFLALCLDKHMKLALYKYAIGVIINIITTGESTRKDQ